MGPERLHSSGPISSTTLAAATANPANQVGPYVRVAPLGSGRAADVWLAYDPVSKREVALKILARVDADERARLLREARGAMVLSHPNIVTVYDVGRAGDVDYIAMQYVAGVPLSRTGVSVPEAARLVREAALAVQAAHDQGLFHLDVKPANLFLDGDRQVRVSDFGLAPVKGGGAPDARQDVYGLGATLVELATGEPPPETGPPRKAGAQVPRDLRAIILKAMARDPARRYAAAGDLAEDLRRFLDREPVTARLPRATRLWITSGLAVAIGIALTVVVLSRPGERRKAETPARPETIRPGDLGYARAREHLDKAEQALCRMDRARWLDHLQQALRELDETLRVNPEHAEALLARARAGSDRCLARGTWEDILRESIEAVVRKEPSDAEARLLRARIVFGEFERRRGGGLGVHFGLRLVRRADGTAYVLFAVPRERLDSLKRAMEETRVQILDDLEKAAGLAPGRAAFAEGLSAFLRGAFEEAEGSARRALDADAADEWAWVLFFMSLEAQGRYEDALNATAEGLRSLPRAPTVLAHRAACFLAMSKMTDAEQQAGEAARLEPDHAPAQAVRGVARLLGPEGRASDGEELQRVCARAGTDSLILRWARSVAYRRLSKLDDAISDLEWLVKEGRTPVLLYERGSVWRRKSEWRKALQDLDLTVRELPELEFADCDLADTREMLQDFEGALKEYQALAARTEDPAVKMAALCAAGLLSWAKGDDEAAYGALLAAVRSAPADPRLWDLVLRCAQGDEDWARGVEIAREWAQVHPDAWQPYWEQAQGHVEMGQFDRALEALRGAEARGLRSADLLMLRSVAYEKMQQWEKTLADIEAATMLGVPEEGTKARQIRMLLRLHRWDEAEKEAQRALEALTGEGERHAYLTLLHAAAVAGRGRAEESIALLRKAGQASPLRSEWLEEEALKNLEGREDVRRIVEAVRAAEEEERRLRSRRPFMGITMQNMQGRVVITGTVRGTGARRAGLRAGDRLVAFDGNSVTVFADLARRIREQKVGDKVTVRLERGDPASPAVFEREVILGSWPEGK
ncbi:MAG: tetratricopeptide repeat protein [Planctomycetes bacterium]|nr:tetratricopeptide repeat protein [Planctomycetota bacterium]